MSETNKGSAEKKERSGGSRWPFFVGLPLIAAVAVAAVLFSGTGEGPSDATQRAAGSNQEEASGLGTPARGSADAPVVMLEYGDFQ